MNSYTFPLNGFTTNHHNRQYEDNNDLRFPRSVHIFAKMLREDTKASAVYKNIALHIKSAKWWIDPNGADREVVEHVANDLGLDIMGETDDAVETNRNSAFWEEHLHWASLCIVYGVMFFEQIYEVGEDGKEHLKKLAPRLPMTISEIVVGEDGVFDGIKQRVDGFNNGEDVFIPKSRLVAYVHDPQDTSWTGSSILRPAYQHWILKNELTRLEYRALDRNSLGIPVYKGSDLTGAGSDPDKVDEELRAGEDLARSIRSGDTAGMSIPAGSDISLLGISGQILSPRQAIEYHDNKISEAALMNYMNLESGSYNLGDIQRKTYIQTIESTARFHAKTATEFIIKDLIEIAFPNYDGAIPQVTLDPIGGVMDITPQDMATLVRDGVFEMDENTESYARRKWGIPDKPSLDEREEQRKARAKAFGIPLKEEDTKKGDGDNG